MNDKWIVVSLERHNMGVEFFGSLEEAVMKALQNIQGRVEDDLSFPEHLVCKIECKFAGST